LSYQTDMEWTVESADIIRLIQAFLTEQGLHHSCEVLREESGIGQVGVTSSSNLSVWCRTGQWDKVLSTLATLDPKRCFSKLQQPQPQPLPTINNDNNKRKRPSVVSSPSPSWALAEVHELAIAELAEVGALDVAYNLFKVVHHDLDKIPQQDNNDMWTNKARSLEQRLAAVAGTATASDSQKAKAMAQLYGGGGAGGNYDTSSTIGSIKQERRTVVANYLVQTIPELPRGRLPSLLQQAIKWQAHTGQLPWIRQILEEGDDEDDDDGNDTGEPRGQSLSKKKKKKKKAPKRLDLLLGAVEVEGFAVVGQDDSTNPHPVTDVAAIRIEPIPTDPYSVIKFGKSATAECFVFLPDASGLVTGSSDGLIEVWDSASKFEKLRTDLPYQQPPNDNDDDEGEANLLGHDDGSAVMAMAVSRDATLLATGGKEGTIYVWRLDTGKCLRKMMAFSNPTAISCLDFLPDASRIIAGSTGPANACRELGLRTSRMLKEFSGHLSTISTCHYVVLAAGVGSHGNEDDDHESANMASSSSSSGGDVLVVTGSLDGTIRIWHGTTAEALRVLQPSSSASLVVRSSGLQELKINTNPAIVAVLQLPSYGTGQRQQQRMIVVPRSTEAIMIDFMGTVMQRYSTAGSGIVATSNSTSTAKEMAASITTQNDEDLFVAACTSPSQKWLYVVTEQGLCHVFEVNTGQWERTIREFALESTSRRKSKSDLEDTSSQGRKFGLPEITGLIHHPHKGIVAAFSNDKTQKRGLVTLWK
jgi:WD40 repeat-containing protein SMU1